MTRDELVESVRIHEAACAAKKRAGFGVEAVKEVAEGVLLVREADGKHTVYFDAKKYRVKRPSPYENAASRIKSIPPGIGFIENIMARKWDNIVATAQICLECVDGEPVTWHESLLDVAYS